jgi:hypothetical protein
MVRSGKGVAGARLVAPVIDLAAEAQGREGCHFQIRNDRHRRVAMPDDDDQRTLVLVEVGTEDPTKIRAWHDGYCVETGRTEDRVQHVEARI